MLTECWPGSPKASQERNRNRQTCRGSLSKGGHIDMTNSAQLSLFIYPDWSFSAILSSVARRMPVYNTQRRGKVHTPITHRSFTQVSDRRRQSNLRPDHSGFEFRKAFQPKLCLPPPPPKNKTYCLLSNGPQFVYVEFFNHDGQSVNVSAIPIIVQGVFLMIPTNRTRYFPNFSAVRQPTAPPRAPSWCIYRMYFLHTLLWRLFVSTDRQSQILWRKNIISYCFARRWIPVVRTVYVHYGKEFLVGNIVWLALLLVNVGVLASNLDLITGYPDCGRSW